MTRNPRNETAPVPPSFPTRRSRAVRETLFVLSALAFACAIYAVLRDSRARAVQDDGRGPAVFGEAFERNVRMRLTVEAFGKELLRGEIVRRTREPYEGRLVVRTKGRAAVDAMGEDSFLDFHQQTRWDRAADGFVMSTVHVRWSLPEPLGRGRRRATATRVRTPGASKGAGDLVVITDPATGEYLRRPIPLAEGVSLSAGFMEAAPARRMYVGARWDTAVVNPISHELERAEVVVVEKGPVPIDGPAVRGFRAVTRVEKETGRSIEQSVTWYDREGRALVCERSLLGLAKLRLVRLERLPASVAEWEKMALPDERR